MPEIGATLREARMHARIDVSEIEAKTKIRAKYLRALENEEWGLLPGPTFVKSFLKTYANALGLDGRALVEEYRLQHEQPGDGFGEPIVSTPQRTRPRQSRDGPSRGYIIAVGAIGALIVLLIILLVTSGSSSKSPGTPKVARQRGTGHHHGNGGTTAASHTQAASSLVTLALRPRGVVYVCLVGEGTHKLIAGVNLQPGETTATYHARHFAITLGNSAVTMIIDGKPRTVTPSAEAIGYTITKARGRQPLASGERPTCQ
jgi:hypothetical protein